MKPVDKWDDMEVEPVVAPAPTPRVAPEVSLAPRPEDFPGSQGGDMTLAIHRPSPGYLTIDVPSEFAVKARVYTPGQRHAFATRVADAATGDVWVVFDIRSKRGVANIGFVADLVTAP